jgi:hypothetical protein
MTSNPKTPTRPIRILTTIAASFGYFAKLRAEAFFVACAAFVREGFSVTVTQPAKARSSKRRRAFMAMASGF